MGPNVPEVRGVTEPETDPNDLKVLDKALTGLVAALLQERNRVANTIVGVAASKLAAAGVMAGVFGAIGAFGVASTGTAIATLSGAAATTATFYWIGSTFGLGASAGGLILTGGAIAASIPAAFYVRRHLFGRRRSEKDLSAEEQAVLYAALRLASAIRVTEAAGGVPGRVEKRLFARRGLLPLCEAVKGLQSAKRKEDGEGSCPARHGKLAFFPRRKLQSASQKLNVMAQKWAAA